jgi:riboflavin kinase/FMN adenylyltransferase
VTVLRWEDLLAHAPPVDRPVRLTLGVFDGLHIGHRRLMEAIVGDRRDQGGAVPLVITFARSPAAALSPASFPGLILSFEQKLARLASLGVGAAVVIDFSEEMSNLSGKAFVGLLRENLTIQKIVVGHNFRFGKSRDSGNDDLKEMLSDTSTDVQVTEPVFRGESIVSSSRIRATIREGDFAETAAMLMAPYELDLRGVTLHPSGPGRFFLQRRDIAQVLPNPGDYTVVCAGAAGERAGRLHVGAESLALAAEGRGDITTVIFP